MKAIRRQKIKESYIFPTEVEVNLKKKKQKGRVIRITNVLCNRLAELYQNLMFMVYQELSLVVQEEKI